MTETVKKIEPQTTERASRAAGVVPTAKKSEALAVTSESSKTTTTKKMVKQVTEVGARANFVRVTPRKVRLVIDQIRGLAVADALNVLRFTHKAAMSPVAKLLNSAIANATNNFEIEKNRLFIKKITADDGPTIKRQQPRAFGRSAMIRKRTSHINLILGVAPANAPVKKTTTKKSAAVSATKSA